MPHDVLKMGPHDVGGEPDGEINTHDHGMTYWEKFSNGLALCVPETGLVKLDEMRKTAESFGDDYFFSSILSTITRALIISELLSTNSATCSGRTNIPFIFVV